MSEKSITSLSTKRIIISFLLLAAVPAAAVLLDRLIDHRWISYMFSLNIFISLLIMYDWNLFGIHYNRSKSDPFEALIYTLIGAVLVYAWHWAGSHLLKAVILLPPGSVLRMYGYARPGMLAAFSFMQASAVNIGFKVLTDRFSVYGREFLSILLSAVVFGLLITLSYVPFSFSVLIPAYLYNMGITAIMSYLYNQSHSFFPGILSLTAVYLAVMILSM